MGFAPPQPAPVAAFARDLEWDGRALRGAAEALGLIGFPAAILASRGRLLAANRPFEELMRGVTDGRGERLAFADRPTDTLFAAALIEIGTARRAGAVRSIPMRARGDRPPMILRLISLCAGGEGLFGASSILVITRVTPPAAPPAELLQGLFDLTPAEARVARGIGDGRTVEDIAELFGLSRETVRSQLKAVLGKTGLGRQADLAALLAGVDLC
ncbi:MAG TPA: LuxR C-terminal-related transcriptional regulator [Burkholderiales bacterium]|nr:LuxR C-terminal-related transcriptional regulator [Burkholderiales bacterium]